MVDVASGYMRTRKYKDNCSSWSHTTSRGVNILDRSMNALRNWRKFCRYMFVYVRQLGWFYWNWSNVLVSCGLIQVYSYTSSLKTVRIHCCRKENLDLCLYRVRYPRQLPCGSYSRILRSAQPLCFDWLLRSGTASTPLGIYDYDQTYLPCNNSVSSKHIIHIANRRHLFNNLFVLDWSLQSSAVGIYYYDQTYFPLSFNPKYLHSKKSY